MSLACSCLYKWRHRYGKDLSIRVGLGQRKENSKLDRFNTGLFYETTNKEKTETNVGITRLNSLPALFSRWYGDASI